MKNRIFKGLAIAAAIFTLISCGNNEAKLTEALDSACWEYSEWISVSDAPVVTGKVKDGWRAADGSSWFVTTVENRNKVVSAIWMTTGLGVYDLYINGELIGDEILKPGYTHHGKTKRSYTYDVTNVIKTEKSRENVFSVQVTPGWWADKIVTPADHDGMVGKKCAFRGVLKLVYSDGSTHYIGSDTENWKAGIAGPVKHAAIFDGEIYDAREVPGYKCIEKLGVPEVNKEFKGEILPTNGGEIYMRDDLALVPVNAYVWKGVVDSCAGEFGKVRELRKYADGDVMVVNPGETLVIDFGQNCAGVPSFVFKSQEGVTLTCLPAELLNDGNGAVSRGMDGPEGSCHRMNLRIPDTGMILKYTFGTDCGFVDFRPRSTFFGYRLVSITATDEVEIKSIRSIPVSSITEALEIGTLTTGNDSINRLISNTLWGQRSNYLSVSTDCPQRNERLGWTADTQVFAETGTFFADTRSFFNKWTRDMRDTQSPSGGFPGVAPLGQYGSAFDMDMMRVGWADAGVIVPWTIWKQFGDIQIVRENWDAMEKFVDHINETKYDHSELASENGNYQWADWLSYEPLESWSGRIYENFSATLDYWNYLSASYWVIDTGMMLDMAKAIGKDVNKYELMLAEAKAYVKSTFINPDGSFKDKVFNTMQTPALFALKNGMVEGEAKKRMIARLKENFAQHDNCLQTGFLGTSILMQTLTENGMADVAYELLFQRKNPSWLYSVDNGATTIWERWNSYTIESGMGPSGMNSFNHYAYGCVCEWIWETGAGISADTKRPGFKHIIMKPIPDRRLGFLKAVYNSAAGLIKSHWRYEGKTWIWEFTIPEGTTASVTLPNETEANEYEAGTYKVCRIL